MAIEATLVETFKKIFSFQTFTKSAKLSYPQASNKKNFTEIEEHLFFKIKKIKDVVID